MIFEIIRIIISNANIIVYNIGESKNESKTQNFCNDRNILHFLILHLLTSRKMKIEKPKRLKFLPKS